MYRRTPHVAPQCYEHGLIVAYDCHDMEQLAQNPRDHLPLVKYTMGRMTLVPDASLDYDDLYQEGVIGLMEACERFDPTKGFKFSSFAYHRIRGQIIDAMRRVRGRSGLKQRDYSIDEMLDVWDDGDIEKAAKNIAFMAVDEPGYEVVASRSQLLHIWATLKASEEITERERWIYVLAAFGWTIYEIGDFMGISFSRAAQIRRRVHEQLMRELVGLGGRIIEKRWKRGAA